MKYLPITCFALLLAGCQTRTVREIRVIGDVGLSIPAATIEVGSIYSGFPYPPPSFISDEDGKVMLPRPVYVNGGSYIVVRKGESSRHFSREDLVFRKRGVLILRLSDQPVIEHAPNSNFDSRIEVPSVKINEN
jgi:hypothetical protein